MLSPYRVLDLTDERGWFAGFLLAQLGAEVVLAEPDGGWRRGYHHRAYNRGKQSVVVADGDRLAALAAEADVVLHNDGHPLSVDLTAMRETNDRLITVHVTPWGETGPKAHWAATDLTLFASSGQLAVTGDSDRPPVRISVPQAWLHGASQAAVAALVALEHRARIGRGQHVDLSTQQAVCETALSAILFAPAGLQEVQREAGGVRTGTLLLRTIYHCKDGHVVITVSFGPMIGPMFRRFMEWVHEEGFCDEATLNKNWVEFALQIQTGEETVEEIERVMDLIGRFAATKTKAEFQERGLRDSLLVCPVNDLQDVLDSPQLAERGFWDEIDGTRYPGRLVLGSQSPLRPLGPAPDVGRPGGHFSSPPVTIPSPRPAPESPVPESPVPESPPESPVPERPVVATEHRTDQLQDRPLAGLKVVDLAWVAAAPLATKILAHWGATVIRVESQNRPCLLRGALGHRDDIADQENAIAWHSTNANKQTIALDLSKPEARQVIKDLAAWGDLVTESFTPGTMDGWGLGYEDLRAVNPELIMLSSCVMGQSGPFRRFAGFGNMAASVAGFFDITGWPDRGPAGPYLAYTDYCAPRFTVCAILAAVDHRRRTGQGQHLDLSQMESATHLLAPALLELQDTGTRRTRRGNTDDDMVPHGVYATTGHDQWIAISVENDEQWRTLAGEMRRADLADLSTEQRRAREAEIDEAVAGWVSGQNGPGLTYRLQARGVPAHQVQNSSGCLDDPQLAHRNHFQWLPHEYVGRALVDGVPYTLSEAHNGYDWAGPTYGEHFMEVLTGILGYDMDRVTELVVAGALE